MDHTLIGSPLSGLEVRELSDLSGTLPISIRKELPSDILIPVQAEVEPFDLAAPPPMLPPQNDLDSQGNPCPSPVSKLATGTSPTMRPLNVLLKENFNIIVLVLLAILVVRGR